MRDYEYIAKRKASGDSFWREYEKWYYYDRENQNYVIPAIILNIICLFTGGGIIGIIFITAIFLFKSYCNNCKLDNNPEVQKAREDIRRTNEKFDI